MSRYGVRWDEALPLVEQIISEKIVIFRKKSAAHFFQSDETDKGFANLQFSRFSEVLQALEERKISVKFRHSCNSGGFLDLPQAHLDMVRTGILIYGVFPSQVCRRIAKHLIPIMSVKAKIATIKRFEAGRSGGLRDALQGAS